VVVVQTLKTVEEVEKERIKALDAVMSQVKAVEKVYDVARKLVQRGVSCQICAGEVFFHAGSEVARKICREFGVKFKKEPHGEHVDYIGELDGVKITLFGELPPGCRVEWEEVVVPEHKEKKAKVVCSK